MSSRISKKNSIAWKLKGWLENNMVAILYIIIPIIITVVVFQFQSAYIEYMSKTDIGMGTILNNEYMVRHIATPYVSCTLLFISIVLSFIAMKITTHLLSKRFKRVVLQNESKWIGSIEIVIVLISACVVIYAVAQGFDYTRYGYDITKLKNSLDNGSPAYLPISEIPSMHSLGISTSDSSFAYNISLSLARFTARCVENLDMYIAIFSAILIPFKWAAHKKELSKASK